MLTTRFLLPAFAAFLLGTLHAAPKGVSGPLVGHVTSDQAALWMHIPTEASATISHYANGENPPDEPRKLTSPEKVIAKSPGKPVGITLTKLTPNTLYHYEIKVDSEADPTWAGSFTTAPKPATPSAFRMVLTSCMKTGQPATSWSLLQAQKPAFHLTLGDTHYADTTNPDIQLQHHLRYRSQPEFASVIRKIPTYAMWDDHDYGPNNSDGTAKGKEQSLANWNQVWANPRTGTDSTPGAFFKFSWGEVDFFVVDGRYHRSPDNDPDDENKRMLGDAQFAWLLGGLKSSKAKFKVIASGSTLHHSKSDGWRIYTFSRHRLFDSLKEHDISGVIYLSGDIHQSHVWEHEESDRVGYPLVEVISSGIANSKTLSFATIDFDTTRDDPTIQVRIIHGDGTVKDDRTWTLSELSGR